ncbi:hypothetical protein N7471_000916 [Penicillium samsonianum]|uniref:uncharacterized protein n=1 Tax=Penicillium samsonianum TaxID=1882272 RepID=UPI0025479814|nr:uncharacterized protein N7471_000916 [Penicillium samsonianum]KAJ6149717.1 hypothetical protein N7471_000916 [Penicillium samsonianum]
MFSTTSVAETKLSELWTVLKCALDTRDPHLFEILTGHAAQPTPKDTFLSGLLSTLMSTPLLHKQFVIKWRTAYTEFAELNSLYPSTTDSSEYILISIFSDFIISKNRRLASHPNFTTHPVFYNANSTYNNKSGNAPTNSKQFYTFHQCKTLYTSELYHLNTANANFKSANAINLPAINDLAPTTANAVTGDPIPRYNNLLATKFQQPTFENKGNT